MKRFVVLLYSINAYSSTLDLPQPNKTFSSPDDVQFQKVNKDEKARDQKAWIQVTD